MSLFHLFANQVITPTLALTYLVIYQRYKYYHSTELCWGFSTRYTPLGKLIVVGGIRVNWVLEIGEH